ncbi:MAG: hypothetical protein SGILL_002772 [Bacillariaceae sp.]
MASRYEQPSIKRPDADTDSFLGGAGIQLNSRQLEMLKARRQGKGLKQAGMAKSPKTTATSAPAPSAKSSMSTPMKMQKLKMLSQKHHGKSGGGNGGASSLKQQQTEAKKTSTTTSTATDDYWAQQPINTAETIPTTWSESTESAAAAASQASSANSSAVDAARSFYGQHLNGQEQKKLYDDTGATWSDDGTARSEVTTSTAVQSAASRASQLSRASSRKQQSLLDVKESEEQLAETSSTAASDVIQQASSEESGESLAPLQSRSESFADAEPHERPPLSPVRTQKEGNAPHSKSKPPRFQKKAASFRDKLKNIVKRKDQTPADDSLKRKDQDASAIVKNLMNPNVSAPKSPKSDVTKEVVDASASDVSVRSSQQGSKRRFHLPTFAKSPRSNASGISREDIDRLKRVNNKKRMSQMFGNNKALSPKAPVRKVEETLEASDKSDSAPSDEREQEDRFDPSSLALSPFKMEGPTKNRGRRSSVIMKAVASGAMNDLIEESVFPDSDDDEEEEEYAEETKTVVQTARSVVSLPEVVEDDEIEIKIAHHVEQSSDGLVTESTRVVKEEHHHVTVSQNADFNRRLSQTKSPKPLKKNHVAHATTRALDQIKHNETKGFDDFVSNLKNELSGSHTNMYDQFHTMIRENDSRPKPLSMYPSGLDLKTKETIMTMSNFAKKIEGVDSATGSQIASDKDVEKVESSNKVQYGQHLLNPTKIGVPLTQRQQLQPFRPRNVDASADGDASVDSESYAIRNAPSSDTISSGSQGAAFEVTLSQHHRKSFVPSPVSASDAGTSMASKKSFLEKNLPVAPSNISTFEEGKKNLGGRPPMPSKAISPKMFVPTAPKETIAWNNVKLRSVSDKSRDGNADSIPASWTKVKLRSVAKNDAADKTINTAAESVETGEFHRIVLKKTPKNAETPTPKLAIAPSFSHTEVSGSSKKPIDLEKKTDMNHPIKLAESRGTDKRPIKIPDNGKGSDQRPIEIDDQSGTEEKPIMLSNEGSVMIALVNENVHDGMETKLLLNKKGLMKVEAIPGESKANVMWRLDREDVKSALLNMTSFEAKLLLSHNEEPKDLVFASSEQCKKFANAIHELLHGSNKIPDEVSIDVIDCVSVSTSNKSESSIYVEQLSEDEQKVLDEFRQRKRATNDRKADFAKQFMNLSMGGMIPKPPSVVNAGVSGPTSPMSEVSGANSLLSANQTKTAETYQRMLRMKVPKEAVKHKMIKEQVDPVIIEKVLGGPESKSAPVGQTGGNLNQQESTVADRYRRMITMGVPKDGVQHKMQKDGVDAKIIAAVVGENELPKQQSATPVAKLSIVEEAVAETYRKMLKMMIPKEAVQHRMIKDGVDPKIMKAVIGKSPEQAQTKGMSKSAALSDAEESIASAYRKMLRLSIPKEAVRQKMTQEGISEKVMTAVLGANSKNTNAQPKNKRAGFKPGFHWNPIADDESIAGSVWSKTKPMSEDGSMGPKSIIDITKHVEMFQKQPETAAQKKKSGTKSASESKEMAKLIDINRANNVAITLKAFNDFSHTDLSQMIEFLDPYGKITGDRALFMKDLLPATAENKAIKSYKGSNDRLVVAEKWFKQIVQIKRIEEKIQVMRTIETFKMDAVVLGKSFQLLAKACNQVMDSDRLPDLLDMVRQIGNAMNEGRGEAAAGFKLDFLPRLTQTKGSDKKTTALDLVVMLFHKRNDRDGLLLSEEIPDCQEASRMKLSDLMTDVRTQEALLRKCQKELEQLKKEMESENKGKIPSPRGLVPPDSRSDTALDKHLTGPNPRACSKDTKTDVGLSLQERSQMLASSLDGNCSLSPRASLAAAIQEKDGHTEEFSLHAAIRRLEKFVAEASCVVLPRLESDRAKAAEACKELASFFCEPGGERAAANLLKILDEFSTDVNRSVAKYDHQQKVDARKKASKKRKSLTGSKPPVPENHPVVNHTLGRLPESKSSLPGAPGSSSAPSQTSVDSDKKSLVLMVNEMLKMAGDKQVKDFKQGVVDEGADDRLKRIYDAERTRKADPLSARREMMGATKSMPSAGAIKDAENAASALAEIKSGLVRKSSKLNRENEEDDKLTEMPVSSCGRRKSRVAQRWSRKAEDETYSDIQDENDNPLEKTDSEILTSMSDVAEETSVRRKKRQSYMDRWASRAPVSEAKDVDEESDIGAFEEMLSKQRQKTVSRWARKPTDEEIIE